MEVAVTVDLVVAVGGAAADLGAGAAGKGVFNLAEVESLVAGRCCENSQDLLTGTCVLFVDPRNSVVGLVVVLEFPAEGNCKLSAHQAIEGGEAEKDNGSGVEVHAGVVVVYVLILGMLKCL
ncbi:hypothetical protein F4680DRAFT_452678 [Xylaria scruposa]|nr:hypothetical protein F4680DRAFT_452678 [Xylaria scruposa]